MCFSLALSHHLRAIEENLHERNLLIVSEVDILPKYFISHPLDNGRIRLDCSNHFPSHEQLTGLRVRSGKVSVKNLRVTHQLEHQLRLNVLGNLQVGEGLLDGQMG